MKIKVLNKNTGLYEEIDSDVYQEIKYAADSGNSTIIPISKHWRKITVLVSGGLDSSLLLYLTAKTIKDLGYKTKILPVSYEVPSKLKSVKHTNTIVEKIRNLLDVDFILPTHEFYIPLEICSKKAIEDFDGKNKFMKDTMLELLHFEKPNFNFNGNTKNPPESIRKDFVNDEFRELHRDVPQTIYANAQNASPHAFMDKADIVNLYIKHGIFDELTPMTVSCDQFVDRIIKMKWSAPCKHCWWCDEREYGFRANGVEDKALPLPNLWGNHENSK